MSDFKLSSVVDIGFDALQAELAAGRIDLVDVREMTEYEAGHIPGALFNPLSQFDPLALPKTASGRTIVLQCRSGRRSLAAMELAQAAGRTDIVTHYGGGMLDWQAHGAEVVK